MKFKFIIIPILLVLLCFNGCTTGMISQNKAARIIMDDLLEAIENDDAEAVKALFAPDVINSTPTIDTDIQEMLDYFEGNIISRERMGTPAGGESIDNGELTFSRIGNARCGAVVTDVATYRISFAAILVNKKNKDSEGLWRIWIGKSDDDHMIIGIREGC